MTQMLLINLFVAFVIQAYTQAYKDCVKSFPTTDDYDKLTQLWSEYDPDSTGLIDPADLPFLIHELPGPLGRQDEYEDILGEIRTAHEDT